jgi:hypothetical protein
MRRILKARRFSAPLASAMLMLMAHTTWGLVPRPASGQSVAPGAAAAPAPGAMRPASSIPPPTRFQPSDPVVRRTRLATMTVPPGSQDGMAAQSVPTAVALPVENGAGSTARPDRSPVTPPPPPRMPVDTALIPGRAVEPIDLANALRLAGARDLDIAIARQHILQAAADLKQARAVAAILRVKQAKLRPFVPSVAFTYAGGGFGGGAGPFFGNFGSRGDAAASLFWDLRNLGFTDVAIMNRRAAERETANLEKICTQTRVAAEVVSSHETRQGAIRQIEEARGGLVEALDSLKLTTSSTSARAPNHREPPAPSRSCSPSRHSPKPASTTSTRILDYNRAQLRLKRAIGQQP